MRQRLGRLLLAAALVVAQYGVHNHALSHLDGARSGGDGLVHSDHAPEVCVAFAAASGGAVGSVDPTPPVGPARGDSAGPDAADPLLSPLALTRFASRAPPLPT